MKASLAATACVLALTTFCASAFGADYYVSPQGDDGNPGGKDKPFKTIAKAAAVAGPGAVIRIQAGTYPERVAPANSGTAEAPITIQKEGPGEVIWTAPEAAPAKGMGAALNLDGKAHFVVDGITFKDCTCWITMGEANHVTVKNCTFDGSRIYNSLWVNNGSFIRIVNCDFKRARPYVTDEKGVSTNKTAADFIEFFRNSHHNLVEGCRFGEIGHVAVSFSAFRKGFRPHHNIIRNCTFTDPMWKCLGVHAEDTLVENCTMSGKAAVFFQFESARTIVRRNLFHGFRSSLPDKEDVYRGAIRLGSTDDGGSEYFMFRDNRVYHNLFTDNDRTITSYAARNPIDDNVFKNNIFFGNRMTLWLCQPDYKTKSKTCFVNNVLCGMKPGEKILGYETKQFTLAEAQKDLAELYQGNVESDPQFADAAKKDFHLKDGSPCIDAGANLTATSADGSGKVVPVEDALYFCDGFGIIDGDLIVVGQNKPVKVTKVDSEKKTLEVDREIAWKKGDAVNQPFSGKAPDIGPLEKQ